MLQITPTKQEEKCFSLNSLNRTHGPFSRFDSEKKPAAVRTGSLGAMNVWKLVRKIVYRMPADTSYILLDSSKGVFSPPIAKVRYSELAILTVYFYQWSI